ncbi:hypothetical protein WKK05_12200 [Nostoc sp. UHCC 0302]|uniref:hypothetical protein n=1 Tax=Nostoc sp. UHCC 0302 TaxID=3134896 RepID=UPI00311C97AB
MSSLFSPPHYPTMSRCIGIVEGKYLPSTEAFNQGTLVSKDGSIYSATLGTKSEKLLQENPELVASTNIWVVWPRMEKESKKLSFHIKGRHKEPTSDLQQTWLLAADGYFSIRGVVINQENGLLTVQIRRNFQVPFGSESAMQWQPFVIEVEGFLPQQEVGDFWELDVKLVGSKLVMDEARLIMEFPKRKHSNSVSAENHPKLELLKETNSQTLNLSNYHSLTASQIKE